MKQTSLIILISSLLSIIPFKIVEAQTVYKNRATEIKKQTVEKKNAVRQEKQDLIKEIKNNIKAKLPKNINGKLSGISGNVLTVTTKEGKLYTIYTDTNTVIKRRFGGQSKLEEFTTGDELAIIGKFRKISNTEISQTDIDAKYIRNLSIQVRNIVFNGEVTKLNDGSFILKTVGRGEQTVNVDNNTIYVEKNRSFNFSDIQVGNRLVVKGEFWNRTNTKTISAKKIMRLPQKTNISPTNKPQ